MSNKVELQHNERLENHAVLRQRTFANTNDQIK